MLATACGAPPCPCARSRLLPSASLGFGYGGPRVRITRRRAPRKTAVVRCGLLPVDPWAPTMDSQSVASQLFAVSLFPYLGFLYFLTRSKTAPGLSSSVSTSSSSSSAPPKIMSVPLIDFMLFHASVFIPGAVPAGIYAKIEYGTSLSNVDWLHGSAESLLTLTNLFIVLGLRGALRKLEEEDTKESISEASQDRKEKSSV